MRAYTSAQSDNKNAAQAHNNCSCAAVNVYPAQKHTLRYETQPSIPQLTSQQHCRMGRPPASNWPHTSCAAAELSGAGS